MKYVMKLNISEWFYGYVSCRVSFFFFNYKLVCYVSNFYIYNIDIIYI